MNIKTGNDLLNFLAGLTAEQLALPVYFDTEARQFEYHMALIGAAYCDHNGHDDDCINLHEAR